LRAEEAEQAGVLHDRLREVDPNAAARLAPRDVVRIVRALEVYEQTGRPLSEWQRGHGFRATELTVRVFGLGLDPLRLHERIRRRCDAMLAAGLVDEVRRLRAMGYAPHLPALQTIGYREIGRHLAGEWSLDAARDEMVRATRRLAKRQRTWFRGVADVVWFDAENVTVEDLLRVVSHPREEHPAARNR
jgi:tRNA dimethylallyltransferase